MAVQASTLATAGPWSALLVTLAMQALVAMASMALPVAAPVIALHLGFPVEQTGSYMAAMFGASILSTLGAGTLVTRHGGVRVSQCGLLLCAAGLALCAVPVPMALACGMVLIGLGYGPITPASSHLLAMTTPAHRLSTVFSLKQTGVPLGGMLAGALVPVMLLAMGWQAALLAMGWQAALLAVAGACIACALAAAPLRERLDLHRDNAAPLRAAGFVRPLQLVLARPALLKLALVSLLLCAIQLSLTTYLVAYLHGRLGYGLVAAGLVLAVAQASGAAGRILWGHAADAWLRPRTVLAVLGLLIALWSAATALLPPGATVFGVSALLAAFGACAIGWNGVYLAEVARMAPAGQASAATAGALVFTYIGMVLGPAAFALVLRVGDSYRLGFAALMLPALACVVLLVSPTRKAA